MTIFQDKLASLTPLTRRVMCDNATEYPNSSDYNTATCAGSYLCRRCGLALFRADSQFRSGCGWPSFDVALPFALKEIPDEDGLRMEIRCYRCDGHLGHVFTGEQFTPANRRHCVNGAALDFVKDVLVSDCEEAIVAGGCFWGVDYYLRRMVGVLQVEVGYIGGLIENPTYEQICQGNTGHYEAVRVLFDPTKTDYAAVLKKFFEIHDPTQSSGQGPDKGPQYQSAVFYYNESQYNILQDLILKLQQNKYAVVTACLPVQTFWKAEQVHQDYYTKHNQAPYCHRPVERFNCLFS